MSSWAKMADDLDRNRKIRKGGRNAREVFLWVLRKVASGNTSGWVKAEDFDDLEWLADELMTPLTDLTDGVSRCFAVGLLERDGDRVRVVGWDGQWAIRKPLTGAERQAKSAAKKRSGDSQQLPDPTDELLTELLTENVSDRQRPSALTTTDATDVVEESREEKSRGESARGAEPQPHVLRLVAPEPVKRGGKKPKVVMPDGWKPNASHVQLAREKGKDMAAEESRFRTWAEANSTVYANWDAGFRMWLGNEKYSRAGPSLPQRPADPAPRRISDSTGDA